MRHCLFKIFKIGSLYCLTDIIPTTNRSYHTRCCKRIPNFRVNHKFFKNLFIPWTISEWNELHFRIHNSKSISFFKQNHLKSITPFPNPIFSCQSPHRIKLLTRLRLRLRHLRKHKFKHSFQDLLHPFCDRENGPIESSSRYLLHCSEFFQRSNHPKNMKHINTNILENDDSAIIRIFLGETSVSGHTDTCVLDSTIEYIISTKWFSSVHSITKFFFSRECIC